MDDYKRADISKRAFLACQCAVCSPINHARLNCLLLRTSLNES